MAVCIQVLLIIVVAILNSIGAYIREWPIAYQIMNIPHFFMYIAIIYYLCAREFHTVAWVVFSLITLAAVDFMILSKKIFLMESIVMERLKGGKPVSVPPENATAAAPTTGQSATMVMENGGVPIPLMGNSDLFGDNALPVMNNATSGRQVPVMRMIGRPPMSGIQNDNVSIYPLTGAQPTIEGTVPYPMAGLGPRPAYGSAAPKPS